MRIAIIILLLLCNWGMGKVYAQVDINKLIVDTIPLSSPRELVNQSSLIVYCSVSNSTKEYPTGQTVENSFQIVNYVQTLKVKKALKGSAPSSLRLLTTGTEPQPLPPHPLNIRYPGPLAEGEYVLFLKPVTNTELHSLLGGWQGVYPYRGGQTVSLGEHGFPQLNGLSINQMQQYIQDTQ